MGTMTFYHLVRDTRGSRRCLVCIARLKVDWNAGRSSREGLSTAVQGCQGRGDDGE
jgi:hypothetical protein